MAMLTVGQPFHPIGGFIIRMALAASGLGNRGPNRSKPIRGGYAAS